MLVMLDLDNTLADRQSAVTAWSEEFCQQYELPAGTSEWILELDHDGYAERQAVFETIRLRHDLTQSVRELLAAYRSRVVELIELSAGAGRCLQASRDAGHSIAIVTNGSSEQQHAKIESLGLRAAVDAIVVSADVGVAKPDAAIFELAAAAAGTSLADSWMVGDSPANDIVGPALLGVRTAWIRRGRTWDESMTPPTVTLDTLDDLPAALGAAASADDGHF